MNEKPFLGQIKTASELGYQGHATYTYVACSKCRKERWVRVLDYEQGKSMVCRNCGYKSTPTHLNKIKSLRLAGAKRASEIGKPVFSKRDPWYYPHYCTNCGKLIYHQKKDLWRVCKECQYIVRNTPSGENHPNWSGGKYNHGDGYIVVMIPPESPYYAMADSKGYCLEHRYIMAQHLGRCLESEEVVHHINGNKNDNRVENLELLSTNTEHLPYIRLQQQIYKLQKTVVGMSAHIKLLEWHIRNIEQANPELAEGLGFRASAETLQGLPYGVKRKSTPDRNIGA